MEDVDLLHYGVKGMKWGVIREKANNAYTKARTEDTTPTDVTLTAPPGKKIQTSGGKYQPTSEDAKRAAATLQKARSSGPQSLSNQEMQTLVTRLNLESQYRKLTPKELNLGQQYAQKLFESPLPKEVALPMAKLFLKNADPKVKIGLEVADMILKQTGPKKKKK